MTKWMKESGFILWEKKLHFRLRDPSATNGDKIVETLYSNGLTSESKRIHTPSSLPPIQSWGVCCFLQVTRIAAQHCMKGMGEGKLYFLLLKSVKRKRSPLGKSVSTNFVADCSLHQALYPNN